MAMITSVCVYCASSPQIPVVYIRAAKELGALLAKHQLETICGAGRTGLMAALIESVMEHGGKVHGIAPDFMCQQSGWVHDKLDKLTITQTMHQRKELMAKVSDGCIAMPGGCGTMEELLEIITWKQLGLYHNPIIILNIDGYYDPLIEMLSRSIDQHFMKKEHGCLWQVVSSPLEAIEKLHTTSHLTIEIIANVAI